MSKLTDRFTGLPLWSRLIAYVVVACIAVFVIARLIGAAHMLIFGNTEAKRATANTVVAQEQGRASKETGIEAANTVTKTYEHYTTVDHTVKEASNAVNRADKGQQMDPDIDAAVAAGLCQLHDDLCRRK